MVLATYKRALASVILILGTASTAKQTGSAVEQFQSLQVNLRESHRANDWHSNLFSANELKELLNEAPGSLLEVARAEVHIDDLNAAFHELEQFTRMGQSTDLLATSSDFAALLKNANFARIQNAMTANRSLISTGSTAFQLSDPSLLAEDVTTIRTPSDSSLQACGRKRLLRWRPAEPALILQEHPITGQCWLSRSIPHVV